MYHFVYVILFLLSLPLFLGFMYVLKSKEEKACFLSMLLHVVLCVGAFALRSWRVQEGGFSAVPRSRPMTNEDFQALIPPQFLKGMQTPGSDGDEGPNSGATTVKLTIKKPNPALANGIEFPEAPTTLGKVTETITKSTFTETVVTRVTDNKLAESYIIEVSKNTIIVLY